MTVRPRLDCAALQKLLGDFDDEIANAILTLRNPQMPAASTADTARYFAAKWLYLASMADNPAATEVLSSIAAGMLGQDAHCYDRAPLRLEQALSGFRSHLVRIRTKFLPTAA